MIPFRIRCFERLAVVGLAFGIAAAASEPDEGLPRAQAQHAGHEMHRAEPGGAPIDDLSIYQLDDPWTDPRGGEFRLAELRGHPVLVLLFYGTCEHVCPLLVRDIVAIDEQLAPAQRRTLRFLLVTFDPAIDTPDRLATYAAKNGLDADRWFLPHGSPEQIRALSLVLGNRYRPTGDGQFSHSSRISLLDREGVVVAHVDGVAADAEPILTPLRAMLAEP